MTGFSLTPFNAFNDNASVTFNGRASGTFNVFNASIVQVVFVQLKTLCALCVLCGQNPAGYAKLGERSVLCVRLSALPVTRHSREARRVRFAEVLEVKNETRRGPKGKTKRNC